MTRTTTVTRKRRIKGIKGRKRRRKKHYHTGTHHSPKCATPVEYRSGWEKTVAKYLDNDASVDRYEYESITIPYVVRGKNRLYYTDFLIWYKGQPGPVLVEVKRQDKLTDPVVIAKAKAAREWAQKNGATYQIWTDKLIQSITLLLEAQAVSKKQSQAKGNP